MFGAFQFEESYVEMVRDENELKKERTKLDGENEKRGKGREGEKKRVLSEKVRLVV